jgi:hypothetical protein
MHIEGSVKSKAFKRGTDKKIAAALGVDPCLTNMVGRLELNASKPQDFAILRELYWVLMGGEYGGGGSIAITNAKGQKCTYTVPTKEELKSEESIGVN